jgi:hypothetical protein
MFVAVLKEGGGCDHTIGCGIRVVELPDRIETQEEAEQYLYDHGLLYGTEGCKLKLATLYKVVEEHHIDLATVYEVAQKRQEEWRAAETESAEREMLAKLQEKYPD